MGDFPWNANEGKFDKPTSSVPVPGRLQDVRRSAPVARIQIDPEVERASLRGVETIFAAHDAAASPVERMRGYVAHKLGRAREQGVVAVGISTIVERIAAATAKLKADGLGDATHVYLVESDMLALYEAAGREIETWEGLPLHLGATSQVYSGRGKRAVRRHRDRKSGSETAPSRALGELL